MSSGKVMVSFGEVSDPHVPFFSPFIERMGSAIGLASREARQLCRYRMCGRRPRRVVVVECMLSPRGVCGTYLTGDMQGLE
jgi:hypothetical protein